MAAAALTGCDPDPRRIDDAAPECNADDDLCACAREGKPPTTISGTVTAPNGELVLFGAVVYVPRTDPGPLPAGAVCGKCAADLPGGSWAGALSDEAGQFTISGSAMPTGRDVPLVVQMGKWRRQVVIPQVTKCQDNPIPPAHTRLPKNRSEGDLPHIAMTTGQFDALECLVRRLGVDVNEFTSSDGDGSIHLYSGNGATTATTDSRPFAPATALWRDLDRLKQYDLALFSCEGDQLASEKTQAMMDNVKAYADLGGRVFLSHFHNIWISGETGNPSHAPAVWPEIATCDQVAGTNSPAIIDTVHNPKGKSFAQWMFNVMGSPNGLFTVTDSRQSCRTLDLDRAERWIVTNDLGRALPQNFQFTTPNEAPVEDRCGKVAFSDMHVASGSSSSPGTSFPGGCSGAPLTAQEKALAFMFFDISACLGQVF